MVPTRLKVSFLLGLCLLIGGGLATHHVHKCPGEWLGSSCYNKNVNDPCCTRENLVLNALGSWACSKPNGLCSVPAGKEKCECVIPTVGGQVSQDVGSQVLGTAQNVISKASTGTSESSSTDVLCPTVPSDRVFDNGCSGKEINSLCCTKDRLDKDSKGNFYCKSPNGVCIGIDKGKGLHCRCQWASSEKAPKHCAIIDSEEWTKTGCSGQPTGTPCCTTSHITDEGCMYPNGVCTSIDGAPEGSCSCQEGYFSGKLADVKFGASKLYDRTAGAIKDIGAKLYPSSATETAESVKDKAREAADVASGKSRDATQYASESVDKVKQYGSDVVGSSYERAKGAADTMSQKGSDAKQAAYDTAGKAADKATGLKEDTKRASCRTVDRAAGAAKSTICDDETPETYAETAKQKLEDARDSASWSLKKAYDTITGGTEQAKESAQQTKEAHQSILEQLGEKIKGTGQETAESAKQRAKETAEASKSTLSKITDTITGRTSDTAAATKETTQSSIDRFIDAIRGLGQSSGDTATESLAARLSETLRSAKTPEEQKAWSTKIADALRGVAWNVGEGRDKVMEPIKGAMPSAISGQTTRGQYDKEESLASVVSPGRKEDEPKNVDTGSQASVMDKVKSALSGSTKTTGPVLAEAMHVPEVKPIHPASTANVGGSSAGEGLTSDEQITTRMAAGLEHAGQAIKGMAQKAKETITHPTGSSSTGTGSSSGSKSMFPGFGTAEAVEVGPSQSTQAQAKETLWNKPARGLQSMYTSAANSLRSLWSSITSMGPKRVSGISLNPFSWSESSRVQKLKHMMEKIESSEYETMPSFFGKDITWPTNILKLAKEEMKDTFDAAQDELPEGHAKYIHPLGSVASVEFVPTRECMSRYTGMFKGADSCLARVSLAMNPALWMSYTPGVAVKCFRDGGAPSGNFVAMFSLDGTGLDKNVFSREFSNILSLPKVMARAFANMMFAKASRCPTWSSMKGFAVMDQYGAAADPVKWPMQIFLVPVNPNAFSSNPVDDVKGGDIRFDLGTLPVGTELWRVEALDRKVVTEGGDPSKAQDIQKERIVLGTIKMTSKFIASKYGDENLFFQHTRGEEDDCPADPSMFSLEPILHPEKDSSDKVDKVITDREAREKEAEGTEEKGSAWSLKRAYDAVTGGGQAAKEGVAQKASDIKETHQSVMQQLGEKIKGTSGQEQVDEKPSGTGSGCPYASKIPGLDKLASIGKEKVEEKVGLKEDIPAIVKEPLEKAPSMMDRLRQIFS